jgi:hypothetical protein
VSIVLFFFSYGKRARDLSLTLVPPQTQSLKAISFDGVISIVGFLGGVKGEQQPTFLDCLVSEHPSTPLSTPIPSQRLTLFFTRTTSAPSAASSSAAGSSSKR